MEGIKEIEMAIAGGVTFKELYFNPSLTTSANVHRIFSEAISKPEVFALEKNLFEKVSYRETTGGMIAVAKAPETSLKDIKLSKTPLILVVESVEKPGNLGAIIRTADAAAVDAVIICDPLCDLFNPNVIRASIGTVFTEQVAVADSDDTIEWLKKNQIKIYTTWLESAVWYHQQDYSMASAIVLGTEATGISKKWLQNADQNIKIPMLGDIDSMNVSVSAAIITYEAKRQRGFPNLV